jgi:hypothetical protein
MATNPVQPLDDSQLYVYCEVCKQNGNPQSPLVRAMNEVQCRFGHKFSGSLMMTVRQFSGDQPDTANMSMVPLPLNEQPPLTSEKWITPPIWVHPKVKAMLLEKYKGRWIATLDSVFGALADGNVLIITGAEVAKLKKKGISNGSQVVAALESLDQSNRERDEAVKELDKFREMLRTVTGS